jgi:hypothetical protein
MKRILLVSALLVIAVNLSFSQMAYKKGDQVVNVGLGVGGFAGAYGSGSIAITGGYESALTENISVGGVIGYSSSSYDYGYGHGDSWKFTYILLGARAAYHYDLLHNPNIDTYGGILLGYNIVSFSGPSVSYYSPGGSYLAFGFFVGGRYYFNPNWAVQAELGYGIGILNVGIAYKL